MNKPYIASMAAWGRYVEDECLGWHAQAGKIVPLFGFLHPNQGTTSAHDIVPLRYAAKAGIVRVSAELLRRIDAVAP